MVFARRKTKRIHILYMKRIVGILAGIIIFVTISGFLDEMYVSCSAYSDVWYPVLWRQFYENEGTIDNLFLGSSHVYCDIDPKRLDRLTGKNNFNLASPGQTMNGSYYLLREADQNNRLSHVYLEMYYALNQEDRQLSEYHYNWNNTDRMKWSFNKAAYMLSIGGTDQYINILFPYTRYRNYLGDWDYIQKTMLEKRNTDFRDYQWGKAWDDGRLLISEKGFCSSTRTFEDGYKFYNQWANLREMSMGEKSEKYCRKIIEYCRKNEIPITLYVSPLHDLELISTQNYDNYVMELRELAAEYDLTVYDFNLAKEAYLTLQDSGYYRDTGHLNQDGAELFTQFFNQVISAEEADRKQYFYDTYQEKLDALAPTVYGTYHIVNGEEMAKREQTEVVWNVASNRDVGMEYRIILTPDEGEAYMIQDFQENKKFTIPMNENGICTIVARMKDFPKTSVQTMEIRY